MKGVVAKYGFLITGGRNVMLSRFARFAFLTKMLKTSSCLKVFSLFCANTAEDSKRIEIARIRGKKAENEILNVLFKVFFISVES